MFSQLRSDLYTLQRALADVEKRLSVMYNVMDAAYRMYLKKEIERLKSLLWDLIDVTIAIFSVVESTTKSYTRRFQGFYDVDAFRLASTGEINYDSRITQVEIEECLLDFRARFGWKAVGYPAKDTTIPTWIETSNFEYITEPKGADVKTLNVVEDEEETYFVSLFQKVYTLSDQDKEEILREVP